MAADGGRRGERQREPELPQSAAGPAVLLRPPGQLEGEGAPEGASLALHSSPPLTTPHPSPSPPFGIHSQAQGRGVSAATHPVVSSSWAPGGGCAGPIREGFLAWLREGGSSQTSSFRIKELFWVKGLKFCPS